MMWLPFSLALLAHFFSPLFFPSIRLLAFAPFLILVMRNKTFYSTLWIAALVGLIVDFSSSELFFGLFSLSYTLATLISYKQSRLFFEEGLLSLALAAVLFSLYFSPISFLLIHLFDHPLQASATALATNFLLMPLIDGVYAFFWFTCPLFMYNQISRTRKI